MNSPDGEKSRRAPFDSLSLDLNRCMLVHAVNLVGQNEAHHLSRENGTVGARQFNPDGVTAGWEADNNYRVAVSGNLQVGDHRSWRLNI
jgi:hypothetical protein